jgi:SAM-dependent methyltransferase
MPEPLDAALAEVRDLILSPDRLVKAVASGRRKGSAPSSVRVELRPVSLRTGQRLQVVRHDAVRPVTSNVPWELAAATVDSLLSEPFGNWYAHGRDGTLQLRVTKRGEAQVHRSFTRSPEPAASASETSHDRVPVHLLSPSDPLFSEVGATAAKRRQVDAFLRAFVATVCPEDLTTTSGARPSLALADLGCGNAYLTFAAYRYLSDQGFDVSVTGVDVRDDQRERNTELAHRLGCSEKVRFVAGTIAAAQLPAPPDVVLALHACDTATDEALARAVGWGARWILAAPCCHHDLAAQLRDAPPQPPNHSLIRDGILRERFADVLTDALRAQLLRERGYRVEVVEFVDSQHTPRNLLLRACRTGGAASPTAPTGPTAAEELARHWGVVPALAGMLPQRVAAG